MGLFDNWSMANLGKNLNPMDSTLGTFWKGDMGKAGSDVMGAAGQAMDFNKALLSGMANPVGAYNQYVAPNTMDAQFGQSMDALVKKQAEDANAQAQAGLAQQQAAEAKAKADKEALYKGSGFLGALQADMPDMFRKREKPGAAAYGSPMGGGF